jgi:hypothetical protein
MRIRTSSDANGLEFQDFGTYKRIQSFESTPLVLNSLGNNVGIGTTAPGYKLDVEGSASNALVYANNVQTWTGTQYDFQGARYSSFGGLRLDGADTVNTIYQASGILGITTGGGNIVLNGGNVGIGTTAPTDKLTLAPVLYSANQNGGIRLQTTDNSIGSRVALKSDGSGVYRLAFETPSGTSGGTAETMSLATGGNVGIGTTAPNAYLNIQPGTPGSSPLLSVDNVANAAASDNTAFIHTDQTFLSGNNTGTYAGSVLEVTAYPENVSGNTGNVLNVGTSDSAGNSFTPYLTVKAATGNVGIGTTAPGALLTVGGTSSGDFQPMLKVGPMGSSDGGAINLTLATNCQRGGYSLSNGTMTWYLGEAFLGCSNDLMIGQNMYATPSIDIQYTSGNVGIGNTSPGYKLSITGPSVGATGSGTGGILQLTTPGVAQGERSGVTLYSTFQGTGDSGPRRTADIIAGYNGGAWGTEYLTFNVGNNGSANDSQYVTSEKMRIQSNGNVGIANTSPSYVLDVTGLVRFTGGYTTSDERYKNTITPLSATSSLAEINQLRPVSFYWDDPKFGTSQQLGFIAQEVQPIFPQLISTDNSGYLSMNYGGMTAPLVSAVQELSGGYTLNNPGSGATSTVASWYQGTSSPAIAVDGSGNIGIGTTTPSDFKLQVAGSIGPDKGASYDLGSASNNWGCVYLDGSTLGTCASDTNLSNNVSDLSFDQQIEGSQIDALTQVAGLHLRAFSFKSDVSGKIYHGLIAQEVASVAPELVMTGTDGSESVNYGDVQWLTVQAVQQLNLNVESIAGDATALSSSTPTSQAFAAEFFQNLFNKIGAWLASATNGIGDVFANTFHAKQEICVNDQCLTADDVAALLALVKNQTATSTPATTSDATTTPGTGTLALIVNGDNPSQVSVGDTYNDLGAAIASSSPAADLNLGIFASVDGAATTTISAVAIDTSAPGTHTIIYSVTDPAGAVATAIRTVMVMPLSGLQDTDISTSTIPQDTSATTTAQ